MTKSDKNSITTSTSGVGASVSSCCICHRVDNEHMILLCDGNGCSNEVHMYCLDPELRVVPRGKWFCPECDQYGTTSALQDTFGNQSLPENIPQEYCGSIVNSADIIGLPIRFRIGRTTHHGRILNRRFRTSYKLYSSCKFEHFVSFPSGVDGRNASAEMWVLLPVVPDISIGRDIVIVNSTSVTWPAIQFDPLIHTRIDDNVLVEYFGEGSEATVPKEAVAPIVMPSMCSQWGKKHVVNYALVELELQERIRDQLAYLQNSQNEYPFMEINTVQWKKLVNLDFDGPSCAVYDRCSAQMHNRKLTRKENWLDLEDEYDFLSDVMSLQREDDHNCEQPTERKRRNKTNKRSGRKLKKLSEDASSSDETVVKDMRGAPGDTMDTLPTDDLQHPTLLSIEIESIKDDANNNSIIECLEAVCNHEDAIFPQNDQNCEQPTERKRRNKANKRSSRRLKKSSDSASSSDETVVKDMSGAPSDTMHTLPTDDSQHPILLKDEANNDSVIECLEAVCNHGETIFSPNDTLIPSNTQERSHEVVEGACGGKPVALADDAVDAQSSSFDLEDKQLQQLGDENMVGVSSQNTVNTGEECKIMNKFEDNNTDMNYAGDAPATVDDGAISSDIPEEKSPAAEEDSDEDIDRKVDSFLEAFFDSEPLPAPSVPSKEETRVPQRYGVYLPSLKPEKFVESPVKPPGTRIGNPVKLIPKRSKRCYHDDSVGL